MQKVRSMVAIDTNDFVFKCFCFGGYLLILLVISGNMEIPHPYEKVPMGLMIGSLTSLFFLWLWSLASTSFIGIGLFTFFMLSMNSSLDWNSDVWHYTTIISRQTLTAGTVITALWIWWTKQGIKSE